MKRCLLLLPALLLVAAADPAVERAARKEKLKLVGVWVQFPDVPGLSPTDLLGLGLMVHEITPQKIIVSHVTFRERTPATKLIGDGAYALDPTKDPKTIDLTIHGKVVPAIYQLNGDQLSLATPATAGGDRPQKLVKSKETGVMVLRRSPHKSLKDFLEDWEKRSQKIAEEMTQSNLPRSRTAKPIDAAAKVLLVDVIKGEKPTFKVAGLDVAMGLAELKTFFKSKHEELTRSKSPAVAVALRADARADVGAVDDAAAAARAAGFGDVFLQVARSSGDPGRLDLLVHDWHKPMEDVIIHAAVERAEVDGAVTLTIKSGGTATRAENIESLEKQLAEQRGKEETLDKDSVRIQPDPAQTIGSLVLMMDSGRAAGFKRVTLSPIPGLDPTAGAKMAAPSADDQAKAEKEIKAIYQTYYDKPANLAPKLREAAMICEEPAVKFVFLREAADASARAGRYMESMETFDFLAKDFTIDTLPLRLEKFKKNPGNQEVVDAALREASNASLAKRRDYAARFTRIAEIAAKETKNKETIDFVDERRKLFELPKLDRFDPYGPLPKKSDDQPSAAMVERTKGPPPVSILSLVLWYGVPIMVVSTLLTTGLFYWLMRERAVRRRLAQAKGKQFDLPPEEPPTGTPG